MSGDPAIVSECRTLSGAGTKLGGAGPGGAGPRDEPGRGGSRESGGNATAQREVSSDAEARGRPLLRHAQGFHLVEEHRDVVHHSDVELAIARLKGRNHDDRTRGELEF